MTRPLASTTRHPRGGSSSAVSNAAAGAARAVLDGAGFALLCLLTATGPSALRRQLGGCWDAGFAPHPPA